MATEPTSFREVEPHVGGSGLTCLLAVGLAGTSHWSASIEEILEEGQPDSECRIRFDVACRLKGSASALESTYQVSQSLRRDASELTAYTDPNGCQVRLVSTSDVEAGPSTIAVRPHPMANAEPTTIRWMYDVLDHRLTERALVYRSCPRTAQTPHPIERPENQP